MKKFAAVVGILTAFSAAFAGEREDLLKKIEKEYAAAEKEFLEKAETTAELVGAAGECSTLSEKHLFMVFDYKLRHTQNAAERLLIIKEFQTLVNELYALRNTPREDMGSLAGMQIYHAEANLMRRQIKIWMLEPEAEKRWRRIADSTLILNGKTIELDRGQAAFTSKMYDNNVNLELILMPENTFTFQGRDFAVIRTDLPFAMNDDFSEVFICEMKNGKLQVRSKSKKPYFSKWELKGEKLIVFGQDNTKEEFSLK